MLIAKAHVVMCMYRLKRSGNVCYKGNVVNIQQDNDALIKSILNPREVLPRKISTLPVIWMRKHSENVPDDFSDFRVKRNNVKKWL